MILTELRKYAKKITKKAPCNVSNGKLSCSILLREGQGVLIDGKLVTVSQNIKVANGDYSLETLPVAVFGGTHGELNSLIKQYLPNTNDICLFVELPYEEQSFDETLAKARLNLTFISKAVLSETSSQAKLEGSFNKFLDKEADYFIKNMPRFYALGVTPYCFADLTRVKRCDLIAKGFGINVIEYKGLEILYDIRELDKMINECVLN